ncbi:MAG: Glutamate-tRNA ligase [Parcubacteria group bacterium GW2011_GWC1_39_29]|nr:MAG: Glutamate-tRNA ligase [Parcubacteria group bacterium GW2011_GWC1_39_29]
MASEFDLTRVHKSGAIWNVEKLDWINAQYIKRLESSKFKEIAGINALPDAAIPFVTERLDKLTDIGNYNYFWEKPIYDKELLRWKSGSLEDVKRSLKMSKKIIENHNFKIESSKEALRLLLDDAGKSLDNRGLVYWPLRVALSGKDKSPDPVEIAFVLGKESTLNRIDDALVKI